MMLRGEMLRGVSNCVSCHQGRYGVESSIDCQEGGSSVSGGISNMLVAMEETLTLITATAPKRSQNEGTVL